MSNSTSLPNDNKVSLLDLTEANDSAKIEKELSSSEKEKLPKKIEINKENITIQTLFFGMFLQNTRKYLIILIVSFVIKHINDI